jgi:adenylate cyclase
MAESVRLIDEDEEGVVRRWVAFVDHVEEEILPSREGRLVKSLGDGMLLELPDARSAVSAALAMQQANRERNAGLPPERHVLLRMGLEVGDIFIERHDVFGRGVNRAARLSALAGPGEIVVSAPARDQLTSGIDADIEDLGECYVRNLDAPIRAYRVGPPGPRPLIRPGRRVGELLPSIAVVPFAAHGPWPEHQILGEVIAEEMIRALTHSPSLHVISRLSTTAFRGRDMPAGQIGEHLGANYVLSGSYHVCGDKVAIDAELQEARSGRIVWADRVQANLSGVVARDGSPIEEAAARVYAAIVSRELQRARSQPLPNVESYTLLMAAVTLMHRLSLPVFEESYQMLQTVADRASRHAIPQAWMAKWHQLRLQQGWCDDPNREAHYALERTKKALDADSECSLALAIDGIIHTQLRRFDVAQERYELAILSNPSDSLAWLLKGTTHAFMGEGQLAVDHTERARRLSPLDPHRYLYDSLAATAYLAANQYDQSLRLAQNSLKANRTHVSTLRAMAIAQWQLGLHEEARATVQEALSLDPSLSIKTYLERSPAAPYQTGREWAEALKQAGVPEG